MPDKQKAPTRGANADGTNVTTSLAAHVAVTSSAVLVGVALIGATLGADAALFVLDHLLLGVGAVAAALALVLLAVLVLTVLVVLDVRADLQGANHE